MTVNTNSLYFKTCIVILILNCQFSESIDLYNLHFKQLNIISSCNKIITFPLNDI